MELLRGIVQAGKGDASHCSQLDGQVENARSDKFLRCSKGWGRSIEGACDSRSILRVLRDCSVHPQGPSLRSEPFIGHCRAVSTRPQHDGMPMGFTFGFKCQTCLDAL